VNGTDVCKGKTGSIVGNNNCNGVMACQTMEGFIGGELYGCFFKFYVNACPWLRRLYIVYTFM
jgi:hypothetical protein